MSIAATGDLMVHLGRIQNIDCFGFGFYHLKVEMFHGAGEGSKDRIEKTAPTFIPPKPFVEHRKVAFADAHIDDFNNVYVSQSFCFRNASDEVELNDIVLFRFARPFRDRRFSRYLRFSLWQCTAVPNPAAPVLRGPEPFALVCSKVYAVASLNNSFAQPLTVLFDPHRLCALHANVKAVTFSFALGRDPDGLRQLSDLTESFAPAVLDRLYALINRKLFRGVKLICAQIAALVSRFQLNRDDLLEDAVLQLFPFQQQAAVDKLAVVERGNRLIREKLLAEAMVG